MTWLNKEEGFEKINTLGQNRTPFLFIISYDKTKIFAQPLDTLDNDIFYKLEEWRNYPVKRREKAFTFFKSPVNFSQYEKAMEKILEEIRSGNTYLLNLTFKTPVESNFSLEEIFTYARAKFKLYFKGEFICFSPERFVDIKENIIATYPMKGTIDANLAHAKETILSNEKEMAEHVMIVDLMRNDLGIVGTEIKVEKNWHENIGTLLDKLTPAGSVTGTPKKSTVNIIKHVEDYNRGFYTGVFGLFDGKDLRSSVMIRFIEEEEGKLMYKSGGGITIDSDTKNEYEELIDKIYLPF